MDEIDMTSEVWQKSCSKQEGRRTSRLSAFSCGGGGGGGGRLVLVLQGSSVCCMDGVGD